MLSILRAGTKVGLLCLLNNSGGSESLSLNSLMDISKGFISGGGRGEEGGERMPGWAAGLGHYLLEAAAPHTVLPLSKFT